MGFTNETYLLIHKRKTDCKGLAQCESCGIQFKTRIEFRDHMLNQNIFECEIICDIKRCNFKACDKIEMEYHINSSHHPCQLTNT